MHCPHSSLRMRWNKRRSNDLSHRLGYELEVTRTVRIDVNNIAGNALVEGDTGRQNSRWHGHALQKAQWSSNRGREISGDGELKRIIWDGYLEMDKNSFLKTYLHVILDGTEPIAIRSANR